MPRETLTGKFNATNVTFDEQPEADVKNGLNPTERYDDNFVVEVPQQTASSLATAEPVVPETMPVEAPKTTAFDDLLAGSISDEDDKKPTKNQLEQEKDEKKTLLVDQGPQGAKAINRIATTNASLNNQNDTIIRRKQDAEAMWRQQAIQNAMKDLRDALKHVEEGLDAIKQIRALKEKGEFDAENPDHFALLLTAGFDPSDVEKDGPSDEDLDAKEIELNEQKKAYKTQYSKAEELYDRLKNNPDDLALAQEIQSLQRDYDGMKVVERVARLAEDSPELGEKIQDIRNIVIAQNQSDQEQTSAISINDEGWDEPTDNITASTASIDDEGWDEPATGSSIPPSSSAAKIISDSQSFENAPKAREDFVAAASPSATGTQTMDIEDTAEYIAKITETPTIKIG